MVIGVCGLGYTGSGAVLDLLNEYEEIEDITGDYEFGFVYKPDGILDLKYHLVDMPCRDLSSNIAVKRFLDMTLSDSGPSTRLYRLSNGRFQDITLAFVESVIQTKWKFRQLKNYTNGGKLKKFEGRIRYKIQRELDKRLKFYFSVFPEVDNYFSILPVDFDLKAKDYIMNIISSMSKEQGKIKMLNQPFSGDRPDVSFNYFDDPYAIVVDRDPRDLFIMMKYICFSRGKLTDDVNRFIIFYKKVRENIRDNDTNRILRIQFEDLIYYYDNSIKIIEDFLGIHNHCKKNAIFKPEVSIQNTQLWKRYPAESENIKLIENELYPYLYKFNETYEVSSSINVF